LTGHQAEHIKLSALSEVLHTQDKHSHNVRSGLTVIPRTKQKTKVRVMLCTASASPQVIPWFGQMTWAYVARDSAFLPNPGLIKNISTSSRAAQLGHLHSNPLAFALDLELGSCIRDRSFEILPHWFDI
jgi:hypothetical protein